MKALLLCFALTSAPLTAQTPRERAEEQQIEKERALWEKQEREEAAPVVQEEQEQGPVVNLQCVCPPAPEAPREEEETQEEEVQTPYLPPGQSDYQYVDPAPQPPLKEGEDRIYLGIP